MAEGGFGKLFSSLPKFFGMSVQLDWIWRHGFMYGRWEVFIGYGRKNEGMIGYSGEEGQATGLLTYLVGSGTAGWFLSFG